MIASLNGILSSKSPEYSILDVNGVGYKVTLSLKSLAKLPSVGSKLSLFIHTTVREDDISLFGFVDEEEKRIFQKLISVNGIGPKLALTILSGIASADLVEALHHEDVARLTSISGIGRKTAERMILDLKDKLKDLFTDERLPQIQKTAASAKNRVFEEAVSALLHLGYNRPTAERTLSKVPIGEGLPVEGLIRQALKILSTETAA